MVHLTGSERAPEAVPVVIVLEGGAANRDMIDGYLFAVATIGDRERALSALNRGHVYTQIDSRIFASEIRRFLASP